MTAKKDLKKRIRARQRQSGERYTTALEQVKAEAPRSSRVQIVVLNEISDQARAAGLRSRVYASSALWALRSAKPERDLLLRAVLGRLVAEPLDAFAARDATMPTGLGNVSERLHSRKGLPLNGCSLFHQLFLLDGRAHR